MIAPPTVTIPAGSSQASIKLDTVQDNVVDGDQVVTVTASVDGYTSGIGQVIVTDRDLPDFGREEYPGSGRGGSHRLDVRHHLPRREPGPRRGHLLQRRPRREGAGSKVPGSTASSSRTIPTSATTSSSATTPTPAPSRTSPASTAISGPSPSTPRSRRAITGLSCRPISAPTSMKGSKQTNNTKITATPVHVSAAYSATVETDVRRRPGRNAD